MIDDELTNFLRDCGVPAGRLGDLSALENLRAQLVEANRTTNLTRITTADEYWLLHVADSLAVGLAVPELLAEALSVADVGCGAGFPMLPLAWANGELAVAGIDSRGKKIDFVRGQIDAMGLAKCRAIHGRARELAHRPEHARRLRRRGAPRGRRAGEAPRASAAASARPGGRIVFYTTPAAADERRDASRRAADKLSLAMAESPVVALPRGAGDRRFVIFTRP